MKYQDGDMKNHIGLVTEMLFSRAEYYWREWNSYNIIVECTKQADSSARNLMIFLTA